MSTKKSDEKSEVDFEEPTKKKPLKKFDPCIAKLEAAQQAINGNIDGKLDGVEKDRRDAEQRELEENARKAQESKNTDKKKKVLDIWQSQVKQAQEENGAKPGDHKMDRVQNWVNNIAEERDDGSTPSSGRQSASEKPPMYEKPAVKKPGPPKVKQKYTSAGRRTSSMSGIDISKTTQNIDLAKLPQPADLRVPFQSDVQLAKLEEKEVEEDWTLLQLQNGLDNSESSSYELINSSDFDDEFEQVVPWGDFKGHRAIFNPVLPPC